MQSYVFDFEQSPTFRKKWNKEFDVEDMPSNCFNIVLVDGICDDNIEDCLTVENHLKYDETSNHVLSKSCTLVYTEVSDGKDTISLGDNVTFGTNVLGDNVFNMKGAFVTNDAGYVMGYSINEYTTGLTNQLIFDKDLILWDIEEGYTHV